MHGLQRRTERISYVRPAVRNYGVRTQQPFSAFKHSGDVILQDPFDNQQKAENQMTWLVRKGDSILSDTPIYATMDICRKFRAQDSRSFRTHLLANDDDFAPTEYLQNGKTAFLKVPEVTILLTCFGHRNADSWCPGLQFNQYS